MKQNRWVRIYEVFVHFAVYPLLVLVVVMGVLTCGLVVTLAFRLADTASLQAESQNQADAPAQDVIPKLKILPSLIPTATGTPSTIPSPTFTPLPTQQPPTSAAIAAVEPAPGAIPVVYPTSGAIAVANPTLGAIPVIYPTPGSPAPPTAALASSPAISPTETLTPRPEYDFMLAEFFNSPTTNDFLMMYVAIVDPNEIPIGDMKIVGTRLDHNLTYESPLSTWHYEGYNAPGQVIKSGNVKFEPPGGIESASWVLHLEDANGNRQSEDIPFDTSQDSKQWYFVKLKRKY
jgi:hypothetical protein